MTQEPTVLGTDLPFLRRIGRGKVRDLYEIGNDLLLVTTDRISAFDVVMNEGIPGKGRILNTLSAFWFGKLDSVVKNHMLSTDVDAWPEVPSQYRTLLRGRSMRCKKAKPLPVEWVVRGYLTGSGWSDYQKGGKVSGVRLETGLSHASRIDPPILTPSTKAETGHDEPIAFEQVVELVGKDVAIAARAAAIDLYKQGHAYASERGIVIADTKFEFGLLGKDLLLIDECLTPDSSRFWPAAEVKPGGQPRSYDKQVLRDWLVQSGWKKTPPPPKLPPDVVAKTASAYDEIQKRLTR
jgi:phosphoribosylaminoimidazole-succinocarboxamide synthase